MKYFIFDMDETIAELYSVYYFVASIKLKELIAEAKSSTKISRGLDSKLKTAYESFVTRIAREEQSELPLGILRPGILRIMEGIKQLQQRGIVKKVAIYSNNGHLESLQLIRDVIHKSIGSTSLIGDCIHWHHPMRGEERQTHEGAANKTWSVLKNILISGPCGAPNTIEPTDVFFFDDLKHEKMGETHYIQVTPYTKKASFDRIEDLYIDSLVDAKLTDAEKQEFYEAVSKFLLGTKEPHKTINTLLQDFWKITKGTMAPYVKLSSEGDNGIIMMQAVIDVLNIRADGAKPTEGGRKRGHPQGSSRKTRRASRHRYNKSKRIRRE